MTRDLDRRLDVALERRNSLDAKKQRLGGKLEASRKNLALLEKECRERGVDPSRLDDTIEKLTLRYTSLVETLEQEVEAADIALAPFLKES